MAPSPASDSLAATAPMALSRRVRSWSREPSEHALIAGALAGDEHALERLFRRSWPQAYRVALLIVHDHAAAEDVAQEAFVAAVRRLERFDRRRPFTPWLLKIVTNRAIDWTRAGRARREVAAAAPPTVAVEDGPGGGPSSELLAALATLPPEQRAVVVLRHLLDLTPGEIARALGLPRGTVNSRLRRGLDALEPVLKERTP